MTTITTSTAGPRLTIEEYSRLPDSSTPSELVRGRIVALNPPYPYHGYVCGKVDRLLGGFVDQRDCGYVVTNDSGIVTERDPDTVRGADVAYYSHVRVPKGTLKQRGYLTAVPDLIVEVRSPDDLWKEILTKAAEYLSAGVTVVCVLDPMRSTATIYRADQPEVTLTGDQELTFPEVLPGFSAVVKRFFE